MADSAIEATIKLKDELSKQLAAIDKRVTDFASSYEKHMKKTERGMRSLHLAAKLFNITVGVKMAKGIIGAMDAFAKFTGRAQGLEKSFHNLLKSAGEDSQRVLSDLREATLHTVDDIKLFELSNIALSLRAAENREQLVQLASVATKLSQVFGVSVSQAFQDLAVGLGRQSRLVLDNLGIIVRAEDAYRKYADIMNLNANALTDAQKRQAFLTEALRQAELTAARAGNVLNTIGFAWQRLGAVLKNIFFDFAKEMASPITKFVDSLAEGLRKAREEIRRYLKAFAEVAGFSEVLGLDPDKVASLVKKMVRSVLIALAAIRDFLVIDLKLSVLEIIDTFQEPFRWIKDAWSGITEWFLGLQSQFSVVDFTADRMEILAEVEERRVAAAKRHVEILRLQAEIASRGDWVSRLTELFAAIDSPSGPVPGGRLADMQVTAPEMTRMEKLWHDLQVLFAIEPTEPGETGRSYIGNALKGIGQAVSKNKTALLDWADTWERITLDISKNLGDHIFKAFQEGTFDMAQAFKDMLTSMQRAIADFMGRRAVNYFLEVFIPATLGRIADIIPSHTFQELREYFGAGKETGMSGKPVGSQSINPKSGGLRQLGGVFTSPTKVTVGEAGPEAIVPLRGMGGGSPGAVVVVNVNSYTPADTQRLLQTPQAKNALMDLIAGAMAKSPSFRRKMV